MTGAIISDAALAFPRGTLYWVGPKIGERSCFWGCKMATAEQKRDARKRWKDEKVKQGLCSQCGREPLLSTLYGLKCLRRVRNYYRERKGLGGWQPGKAGTVPYEYRTGPITFPKTFNGGLRLIRVNQDGVTAYYRSMKSRSPFKGAWITVRVEQRRTGKTGR